MSLVIAVEVVILLIVVAILLCYYAAGYVPGWVAMVVYLSWFCCFSIVLILPIDIYYSLKDQPDRMLTMWRIIYWTTFLLAWVILPLIQDYEQAGEFTPHERLKRSLRNNFIFYMVILTIGVLGIVYLVIKGGFAFSSILTYAMALGNCVGLLLLVILLAHGIPEIPKSCWRSRSLELMLRAALFKLAQTREKGEQLFYSLQERVSQLKCQLSKGVLSEQCTIVLQCVPQTIVKKAIPARQSSINEEELASIHKEVKFKAREYIRCYSKEKEILKEGMLLEDIIKSKDNPQQVIVSDLLEQEAGWVSRLRWFWHCKLKNWMAFGLFVVTVGFAVLIIIAEISIFIPVVQKANPIALALEGSNLSFIKVNIVSLTLLSYICYCVYSSLFEIKLAGYYGLHPNQQTDSPSLLFSALNCTRVTYAICYNFLQLSSIKNSSFTSLMGKVEIFPVFGTNFRYVFPILLLVLIAMNSFDAYSKIMSKLGLKQFVFSMDFTHDKIEEGKKQLALARQSANSSVLNRRTTDLKLFKAYEKIEVFFSEHEQCRLLTDGNIAQEQFV